MEIQHSLNGLSLVKEYDRRMDINEKKQYSVIMTPNKIAQKRLASVSGSSFSNVQFDITTATDTLFDSNVKVVWDFSFQMTLTNSTASTIVASNFNSISSQYQAFALRCFPISSVMQNVTVNINGNSFTSQPYLFISALERFVDPSKNNYTVSQTPNMKDSTQIYNDLHDTIRSPLANYNDANVGNNAEPRGGYLPYLVTGSNITAAAVGVWTFYYKVTESIFCSPLTWSSLESVSLANITTLNISMSFLPSLARLLSVNASNPSLTSISVASIILNTAPVLLYTSISPDQSVAPIYRDKKYFYKYNFLRILNSSTFVLNAGVSVTREFSTNSISGIPEKVYIFARRSDSTADSTTTDTFAAINSLSLSFGNAQGLFSSADPADLYQISCKNGLKSSWLEHSQRVGSILCLEMGTDIELEAGSAPGMVGSFPFSFNVNITNLCGLYGNSSANIEYQLYAIMQYPGVCSITTGGCEQIYAPLSISDVAMVKLSANDPVAHNRVNDVMGGSLVGGGWFSNLIQGAKNVFSRGVDIVKQALPVASNIANALRNVPVVGQIASPIASGLDRIRGFIGSGLKKLKAGGMVGGALVGGSSTNDLTDEEVLALEALANLPDDERNAILASFEDDEVVHSGKHRRIIKT